MLILRYNILNVHELHSVNCVKTFYRNAGRHLVDLAVKLVETCHESGRINWFEQVIAGLDRVRLKGKF